MPEEDLHVPLIEEKAKILTKERVTGKVRVTTHTDHVTELAKAELQQVDVIVERVPIDQEVDAVPQVRTEGDITIIPVLEEVLVVEKRLVLKEEIRLTRRTSKETLEVPIAVRRQSAEIKRIKTPEANKGDRQ